MDKIKLTRKELYDLVWAESLRALARRFNIQYSYLRKICKDMNVPVPPNGHWSKLKFWKPVIVIKLPPNFAGTNEIVWQPVRGLTENSTNLSEIKSIVEEIKADRALPLKVPRRLTNPDKLIMSAERSLTEHPLAWWNTRGMVRTVRQEFDIRVSPANINRALRFLDTFIKLLRARGHDIINEYGHVRAIVEAVKFDFNIREKNKQKTFGGGWGSTQYKATGLLSFTIEGSHSKTWNDSNYRASKIKSKYNNLVCKS